MVDTADIAWTAGIFEGEGTISFHPRCKMPRLMMEMTDEDIMERFFSVVGSGHLYRRANRSKDNAPRKDIWRWEVQGIKSTFEILSALYPYLGNRRRKRAADVIAEYYLSDKVRRKII